MYLALDAADDLGKTLKPLARAYVQFDWHASTTKAGVTELMVFNSRPMIVDNHHQVHVTVLMRHPPGM